MKPEQCVLAAGAAVSNPEPGLTRHMLAYNPELMLVQNVLEKGWRGTLHSHPHTQAVFVLRGHIQFASEGRTLDLCAGDSVVVAGDIDHQAWALEDSAVLDVFTPARRDFLG